MELLRHFELFFIMLQYSCSLDLNEVTFKVSMIISHQSEIISDHLEKHSLTRHMICGINVCSTNNVGQVTGLTYFMFIAN